jgi:hypothetical protein
MRAQEVIAALPDAKRTDRMGKVLLSLREEALRTILYEANMRDISVQELLRAFVIPEWVRDSARGPVQTVVAAADHSRRQVFHRITLELGRSGRLSATVSRKDYFEGIVYSSVTSTTNSEFTLYLPTPSNNALK